MKAIQRYSIKECLIYNMKMESFFEASRFHSCFDRGEGARKKRGKRLAQLSAHTSSPDCGLRLFKQ